MKVKRFFAATMQEALRLVREEMGADAVILSNQKVEGGVEVVSALDYDEQLAISQNEMTSNEEQRPSPTKLAKMQADRHVRLQDEMNKARELINVAKKKRADVDNASEGRSELADSALLNTADSAHSLTDLESMKSEIHHLKDLLNQQMQRSDRAQEERDSETSIVNKNIADRLVRMGVEKSLVDSLLPSIKKGADIGQAWNRILAEMSHVIAVEDNELIEQGGIYALVGQTGAGKTTTIGKLAARYVLEHGAESIALVNNNRDKWLDLSDRYFVVLGATSAMGPLYFLLSHGANIIAVDLNRDFIWKKLFAAVKDSCGTLIFPVKKGTDISALSEAELAKVSGSDLLSETPEIANWLSTIVPGKQLTIGNYTYLDGALHVQLSLACDSIISRVCDERKDTNIAFLCTPTDNHVVTKEAYLASKESLKTRVPWWVSLFYGKFLGKANYKCMKAVKQQKGEPIYIIDGIAVAQGPNYALAKRMQHWRAVIAFSAGHVVSSNVAPSTATESVVHNAQFAAAYGGMHHFEPMEVMYQRTSLAVMGALLIHDVCNEDGAGNPKGKIAQSFRNPFELFSYGAFHGGVWRCSYKIDKIGVPSAVSFYLKTYKLAVTCGTAAFVVGVNWLLTGNVLPFL